VVPQIIAHLQANTTSFPTIQNAWTMEPVEDLSAAVPALYLFPGEFDADPDIGMSCPQQLIVKNVDIFLVCTPGDFDSLFLELWNTLVGYQVDPYHDGLAMSRSFTERITGQYLWRHNIFVTRRKYRQE